MREVFFAGTFFADREKTPQKSQNLNPQKFIATRYQGILPKIKYDNFFELMIPCSKLFSPNYINF